MKRSFTLLAAALMLLTFLVQPLGLRGQNTFEKVTSNPNDWTGEYLLVYEVESSAYCWTGVDAADCYEVTTISDGVINAGSSFTTIVIQPMEGGYSIQVNGGTNNGQYISGQSGTNKIVFGGSPVLNTLEYSDGCTSIVSNTSVMRYNNNANNNRFRYFKSTTYDQQEPVQLYKKSGGSTQQTVATPTFNPAGGTYGSTQTVTISCATNGATIYYTTNGSDPITSTGVNGSQYTQPITISETTTVKAIAVKNGMNNSSMATATYTIQQLSSINTIPALWDLAAQVGTTATPVSVTFNNWYVTAVKGGQAFISDGEYGFVIYQSGHGFTAGDKLNGTVTCNALMYQNHYAELTGIHASDLTVTSNQEMPMLATNIGSLELRNFGTPINLGTLTFNDGLFYDETGMSITPYNNFNLSPNPISSLESGKQYQVKGISIIYWPNTGGQTQQVAPRSAADFEEVTSPMETVATPTFSPAEGTYTEAQTVSISCATAGASIYYTLDGTNPTPNSMAYSTAINISETTTIKAIAMKEGMNASEIATAIYTIEIVVPQDPTTFTLITNANALIPGDKYIIVGINNDGAYKAMGKQNSNNRSAVIVNITENNAISLVPAVSATDTLAFELTLGQDSVGYWTLYDAVNNGYLYAASSSANQLKTQANNNANGQWTIEIDADGIANIKAQGANTRNWLKYNGSNDLFSCYSSGQLNVYLYKSGEVPTPPTPNYYTVNIAQGIANGTVTANPTQALEGATINVTATPSNGYELETLTYSYAGVAAPIDIKETKQFTMPAADVTINATFAEQQGGPTVISIAEARALELNAYALVQGVVTFIDGRNVYIQDNSAGIDLYLNNNTVPTALAIGDIVKAYGKRAVFNGLVELSGINGGDEDQFSIVSSGNELPLAVKTIAEILNDFNGDNLLQSTRVKIEDAVIGAINTSGNTPISQGQNTMNIYRIPTVEGLLEGDNVTVTGIIGCYTNVQLRVNSANDVEFTHQSIQTVATPTFSPAPGTYYEAQNVTIACETQGATIFYSLDGTDPTPNSPVYSTAITISETTTVKAIAMKEGWNDSEIATANYTIATAPSGSEFIHVSDLSQLSNGSRVIIAARYNENANEYYAMTAQASGKPNGVLFTSVTGNSGETVPSSIATDNTMYWTLGLNNGNFTFINAEGNILGYTSSTNFATGGDNTEWSIVIDTAEATAMVPGHVGFVITNVNIDNRAFALNANHNFGPYHTQNTAGENYNFFLDIFASEGQAPTYYNVNIAQGIANGSITANPMQAIQGATITVTATPANGYELETLTYSVTGSAPVDINQTTMQFVMPAADVTINATFTEQQIVPTTITIAEARDLALNEYATIQGVVTFIDGRNIYVQDETAGIDLYLNSNTVPQELAIGDLVQAYGKRSVYNNLVELSGINGGDETQFNILSSGNTLPLVVKTIAEILNDFSGDNMLQSTRVKIEDAVIGAINTSNNTPITQGENMMNIYKIPVVEGLNEGDYVTVIGVIGCFTNPQLRVNSADDVTFTHSASLVASPNSLSGFTYTVDQGPSEIKSFQLTSYNLASGRTVIYPSENYEISSFGGDRFSPERRISITSYSGSFSYPFYVRLKEGLPVGNYNESLTIAKADFDTIYVACSGYVTEQGQGQSSDYIRIADISQVGDGAKVIFAARFNENANDYYAMTAQTSGKPEGVLFTSVIGDDETLPSTIVGEESTYYWTVTTDGTNYTFTNADGNVLGYTSSTNFSTGGDNINWNIEYSTSEEGAMVPNYSGFVITNGNVTNRAFALNGNHNFGPYHTQNMGGENYNFFLDIFATAGGTPTCAVPTFNPEGGTYFEAQTVTISCGTAGATILYTIDGSDPTPNSMEYTEPILVANNMTIKAIAIKEGFNNSNIATAVYNITIGAITVFNQDWEGDMNGWTFVTVEGIKPWIIGEHNGNHYAYGNGYNGGANEQWCISPAFDLNTYSNATLSFVNAKNYSGPDMELYFSNNYNGETPATATWIPLEFNKSTGSFAWAESGSIDLSNFTGSNCYIGFKYISTETEAAAWEVDDVTLMGFTTDPYLTVTPTSLTGFTYIVGNGPSAAKTFTVSGGNLPPAPGGTSGGVTITCDNSHFEFSLDGEEYWHSLTIQVVETLEPTTVYVRLEAGLYVGQWDGVVTLEDGGTTATVTLSGTVTEEPVPGGDWTRIHALTDLHDGDQVIIASRYDATVGDGYYAMTAGVSGKPDGVLFTSVNNNGVETLPASITDEADTYLWNVTVNGNVITFTNAAGDALGYSSSTNFSGNTSTDWNIAYETAGDGAMIPNYTGFLINNAETTNRCIVMNANYKFGAYHTNNINSADYNFYLDLFVQGGSTTPTVATPVFNLASGTYYEEIDVEITCTTEDATIYYTIDGTDPTAASSVYSEPIHVDHDMTIKAIAMKEGFDDSGIAIANYVINTGMAILFNQDWEGEMEGWTFVTVEGNKPWTIGTYAGNKYASVNGYNDNVDNEQWCISPAFNLDEHAGQNITLSFMNATKFEGPALELCFSNDYDGQDPTTATWQPLSYIASEGNYTWTESGDISLNAFSGTDCYIGFKYISTVSKSAAAWEIDDILLTADMSNEPYLSATPNALTGFQSIVDNGPSGAQTFVLTGGNLPPAPGGETGGVTLTVNNHFEISLDGVNYTNSSLTIPDVVGTLEPTTVYVRLNGLMLGHYEGIITIEDFVEITVALSGDVVFDTGVNDDLAENVKVWNCNNEIMIENNSDSPLNMAVYNILGQAVMTKTIATGSINMAHNLSSGLYIITLSNSQGSISTKMVVK